MSGRKVHNDKWMASYNDYVDCFESGMAISERQNVSERTICRYKAYYEQIAKELKSINQYEMEQIMNQNIIRIEQKAC